MNDAAKPPTEAAGTVADAIAATLRAYGVRFAFGIPGNDVLELIRAAEDAGIRFVLAKSEPSAAFMADAIYQVSGAPAALVCALGPGIANAVSGIAGAWMERSAMLVLTGEMASRQKGVYNHQVFGHVDAVRPVVKHADELNPARAAQQVARALDIALAEPPGPTMLNVSADYSRAAASGSAAFRPPQVLAAGLAEADAYATRALLASAKKPVALIGRGALREGARALLQAFLEAWAMPFLATYKAKGIVDERHPLCLGAVGLSPVVDGENLKLIGEADLLVPIGFDPIELRDAWLDAWPEAKPVLTIDRAPQTHRIFPVGRQAIGRIETILAQLMPERAKAGAPGLADAAAKLKGAVARIVAPRDPKGAISPAALFKCVSDTMREDWLVTVDVGAHRILANHAIHCVSPGQLLQSNGLGCMGYALPAAIGAQLAKPEAPVVALIGDGCLLMTLGELGVAAELGLPLVVVALNDSALALIKLKQSKMQLTPRAVDFQSPRFDKIAEGFGARGVRVSTLPDFERALNDALAARALTVIDARIDPSEYWEQM